MFILLVKLGFSGEKDEKKEKEIKLEGVITDTIAYFFAKCTNNSEVCELGDILSDIIKQEKENRLYELRDS